MIVGQLLVNAARAATAWFQGAIVEGATAVDTGTPIVLPTGLTAPQLAQADAQFGGVRAGVATDLEVLRAAAMLRTVYGDKWRNVGDGGEPAFTNSWVNYDVATNVRAGFRLDGLGGVKFKGFIKSGTVPSSAFTLPVGARPLRNWNFSFADNAGLAGRIEVRTDGTVQILTGANNFVSLDSVAFSTVDV